MPVSIVVHDACSTIALDEAFASLRAVDRTFSIYRPDSEISRIAAGSLAPPDASDEVQQVLALCEDMRARTGGFFDVRAAGRLDPSGVVKGWAVERAARLLSRAGARRFCVNAGGDVVVRGGERWRGNDPCRSHPWRVGIQHPVLRERLCCVVELNDGAVATSGTYERGPHIVDPHTGSRPDQILSVTVLGPDLAAADAYATAAFAMGEAGPAWTASLRNYHAMTILADGRVLCTPGFLAYCPGGSPGASLDMALPSGVPGRG